VKIFNIRDNKTPLRDNVKLVKTLYLDGLPVLKAQFLNESDEVLTCGLKRHLLSYNLINDHIEKISSHLFTDRFDKKIDNFCVSPNQDYISLFNDKGYIMVLSGHTK